MLPEPPLAAPVWCRPNATPAVWILIRVTNCLTGIFILPVDQLGHVLGPDHIYTEYAMRQVDAELYRVIEAVEEAGDINLMVFSDHGMAERLGGLADPTSGLINILDYINETDWEYAIGSSTSPTFQIWPKDDNEEWVSFKVWRIAYYDGSVLFFSRPRSEGWPHHGRTFSIYPCPLSF